MSFSGKKYRRKGDENVEDLLRISTSNQNLKMIKSNAPIFSITRLEEDNFRFCLQIGDKVMRYDFRLGEEFEMEKMDGSKLKFLYTLESENVLKQRMQRPDGTNVYFTKVFGETETKMTITMDGTDVIATVFYELIK